MTHRKSILARLKTGNRNASATQKICLHMLAGEKIRDVPDLRDSGDSAR